MAANIITGVVNEREISKVIVVRVQIFEKIMFSEIWNILTSAFQPVDLSYSKF